MTANQLMGYEKLVYLTPIVGLLASGPCAPIERSDGGAAEVHQRFLEAFAAPVRAAG
jgi:hypothetical protein